MYDELIKRLRRCASYDPRFVIQDCEDAADIIEELVEDRNMYIKAMADEHNRAAKLAWENRWIPVTERLPDNQCDVLCDDEGRVVVGYYTDEEIGWHDMHIYKIYPTHWMPLPEPPKEG